MLDKMIDASVQSTWSFDGALGLGVLSFFVVFMIPSFLFLAVVCEVFLDRLEDEPVTQLLDNKEQCAADQKQCSECQCECVHSLAS